MGDTTFGLRPGDELHAGAVRGAPEDDPVKQWLKFKLARELFFVSTLKNAIEHSTIVPKDI